MEKTRKSKKLTVRDLALAAMFAAVIAVCAWVSLPLAVPMTLQTFGVFAAAGFLGLRRGLLAVGLYILLGALGLPVFAGFRGGFGVLLGTTGGYITGFLFAALAVGFTADRWGRRVFPLALSMLLGLALCYAFGTAWFMAVYARSSGPVGLLTALSWCVFPYIAPDLLKISLAAGLVSRLGKIVVGR